MATARRSGRAWIIGSDGRHRTRGIACARRVAPIHPRTSATATTTAVHGPLWTVTDARGTAAATSTTRRSASALAYAAIASGHAADWRTAPTTAVAAPNAMIGAKSGTATRFASGETSETRPKTAATIGIVGADAAIVAARPSAIG